VLKIVFKNTIFQVLGKALTAATTLIVTLLIGKFLGPTGYGDFAKIFTFVGYFYVLADFGINSIFVKLTTKDEDSTTRLFTSLVTLRLVLGISFALLASSIAFILPYNPAESTGFSPLVKIGIIIASITILSQSLYTSANAYFQKILRYDFVTVTAALGSLAILITAALASFKKASVIGYSLAYVIGGLIFVLASYFFISRKLRLLPPAIFFKQDFPKLLSRSWPIGIALIANLIYFRIDIFILANTRKTEEVGLYALSYQFFEAALSVPIFFANSIFPILANLYQNNKAEFVKQFKKWQKLLIGISLVLLLALVLLANLIPLIYDDRFKGSVLALQILALGLPFFFMTALYWHILIIYNRQKYLTTIYVAGAIFNLVLNLILIPIFGYLAAAATTVISEIAVTVLLFFAVIKKKSAKDLL